MQSLLSGIKGSLCSDRREAKSEHPQICYSKTIDGDELVDTTLNNLKHNKALQSLTAKDAIQKVIIDNYQCK